MNYKKKRTVRVVVGVVLILIGLIFFGAYSELKNEYQDVEKQTVNVLLTGQVDHTSETAMYVAIIIGAVLVGFGTRLIVKKPKMLNQQNQYTQEQYTQTPYTQTPYTQNKNH